MGDYPLLYEELHMDQRIQVHIPELIQDFEYLCGRGGCPNHANVEWMLRTDDGELYYEYRCDEHPIGDQHYERMEELYD